MRTPPKEAGSTPGFLFLAGQYSRRELFCCEQRAVLADGTPTHRESGFIRILEDGDIEMWNAQSNGRTEVPGGSRAVAADRSGR
ncbi:MAG: hypothetical protein OEU54_09885 [Gemmatimonadota bacterium]|nr:hypothetical protein [Gemmatimonadota bacterium]